MKKILILLMLFFQLSSCDFTYTYWSNGNYEVWDTAGAPDGCTLYNIKNRGGIGRVSNILEIGTLGNFIIAKSHNYYDESILEYWILDTSQDNHYKNSDEIMMGPFTFEEFENEKKKFGIESLTFQKSF